MTTTPRLALALKHNAFTFHHPVSSSRKPISLKANFTVKDWPSDACSKALSGYRSPFDSTVASRIKANYALIGLNNMDEFGMGNSGRTSCYGPTTNPWGEKLSCGGSSSGSAVAVATRAVFAAIGSDTGGSVRLPAAHCGVVGFKPTRGAISRFGLIAYASSLDVPGVLAGRVRDVAEVLDVVAGPDEYDSTCIQDAWKPVLPGLEKTRLGRLKVALAKEFFVDQLDDNILDYWKQAANMLTLAGCDVVSTSVPSVAESLAAYYVIALAEASSNLARYDGVRYGYRTKTSKENMASISTSASSELHDEYAQTRTEAFGEEVQRRLLMGCVALTRRNDVEADGGSYYASAERVRTRLRKDFLKCFKEQGVDVFLLPTSPWSAAGSLVNRSSAVSGFAEDIMTVPASLCGLPAISIPVGVDPITNSPIGLQIIGRPNADEIVLRVALELEHQCQFPGLDM